MLSFNFEHAAKVLLTPPSVGVHRLPYGQRETMTLTTRNAYAVPPSPAEWRDMENTHLAWLRIAHVIANAPSDDCVKELVASMPDRGEFAKGLAAAASVLHDFGDLAADAERRFLDACVAVGQ
jgi:hypothetical protein